MNIKIAGQSSKGNYQNTGGCGAAVIYSEHELRERPKLFQELGIDQEELGWFDMDGHTVTGAEVMDKIDRMTAHLGKDDAKFYCMMINPSDDEAVAMGDTINKQITNGKQYIFDVMDAYAKNFNREQIKDRHNLVAYAIPHIYKSEGKQQLHWHVIQARLSRGFKVETENGKYRTKHLKLSPMTNHRNTQKGRVQGGFERTKFVGDCEQLFDKRYNYQRKVEESFDYCLAEKKGTAEEKAVQETRLALQNLPALEESIKQAVTRRVERLAKEATERAIQERQAAEEKARIEAEKVERANKNKFWNTYNSHYKPLVDGVQKSISDSFRMHDTLKAEIRDCGREISDRYDRLRQINDHINKAKNDIDRASSSKGLWTALSGLVTIVNPVAGLVMGLVSRLVIEANKSAAIETRKALYAEAKAIRDDIGILKKEQSQLRAKDADVMKVAVEDKAARKELFDEINILKAELTKPIEPPKPKFSFDFKAAAQQTAHPVSHSQTTVAAAMPTGTGRSKVDVYSILLSSKNKDALDLALLEKKVVIEPMKDLYGGVADFSVTLAGEGRIVNASSLVSGDQLRQMVNKWENLTGQQPAYKLEIQREDQRKLADICAKMDAASPENAPRTPKSISHLPGGEIDVTYTTRRGNTTTARIDADGRVKVNNVMLDINTGRFTQLPSQRQAPRQSQEGKSKGNSLKK